MTCLSFQDIFANAMCFHTRDGLLYRSAIRFSEVFQTRSIPYFIVGGYALIHHGIVRNTTDIDMVVNEDDFLEAVQILRGIGYSSVLADGPCARFQHEEFLPIDLLSSPVFAPHPSQANRVHYERSIFFCNLPTLIQTKVKAMIGRPLQEKMLVKRMRDHVDLCELIVHHQMNKDYARTNNLESVVQAAFERIHCEYYRQLTVSTSKTKVFGCLCQ